MLKPFAGLILGAVFLAGCDGRMQRPAIQSSAHADSWVQRKAKHTTNLVKKVPLPQQYNAGEAPPAGVREVRYKSGDPELKAWYSAPASGEKLPPIVYFHGGFAFGTDDFEFMRPFAEAGFVILTPMLSGENGNPVNYEMWYGEADDGYAAIEWLFGQNGNFIAGPSAKRD